MANYFNLSIDTTAPQGVSLVVNDGAEETSSAVFSLAIGCTDEDTTGYKMKVYVYSASYYDDNGKYQTLFLQNLSSVSWVDYATSYTFDATELLQEYQDEGKDLSLVINVAVSDSLYNISYASDEISLYSGYPTVTVTPNISLITTPKTADETGNTTVVQTLWNTSYTICLASFTVNKDCTDVKVMIVGSTAGSGASNRYDNEANALVVNSGGTGIAYSSTDDDGEAAMVTISDDGYLSVTDGTINAGTTYYAYIRGLDLAEQVGEDGCYCIKIFAKEKDGNWSL